MGWDSASNPAWRILQVGFQDANTGQLAIFLGKIEPISDDELVGNGEPDKIGNDIDFPAAFFFEEGSKAHGGGL